MKKISFTILIITGLAGCSTPVTMLIHPETKQTVQCGGSTTGSLTGGLIGYNIEKTNAQKCVINYLEAGFVRVESNPNAPFTP